jgi:uncharacterized protein YjbI with pentapeptide repeats
MANQKHLQLLLSSSATNWNNWRQENPHIVIDLQNANLSKCNLSQFNLKEANLEKADLSQANLTNTNLTKANLTKANLTKVYGRDANFSLANLQDANCFNAYFIQADFSKSCLLGFNFQEANCTESFFIGSNLGYANLCRGIFQGVSFLEANLQEANLREIVLNEADLTSAKANNTDFSQGTLTGIIIEDWQINDFTKFEQVICNHLFVSSQEKITTDFQCFPHTSSFLQFALNNNSINDVKLNEVINVLEIKKMAIEEQIQQLINNNTNQHLMAS